MDNIARNLSFFFFSLAIILSIFKYGIRKVLGVPLIIIGGLILFLGGLITGELNLERIRDILDGNET
jgi:hypothetical protein